MFLKSIEVHGFKSFANKLTFEFHKGITGIVGPNGSGKSNVADAVRWVLGEQSTKQLRGSKMEDVIFSGTELRKPLGYAYVAITLDNSDHKLSIDYDTVTVSRRVYRSGESEYKINGHNCRLKDIQELFFDTGIGKEGYSIIGQGQIDKILSGKPEDRRELFDEAVGIVKYKKRKALTVKNLEQERLNLSRVKDILFELEKQVGPLEKQSENAKIYLGYKDELRKYDATNYVIAYTEIRNELNEVENKISIASSQLEEANQSFEEIKTSYEELESLMQEYDEKIRILQDQVSELSIEKQRLEGLVNLNESQANAALEKQAVLSKQIDDINDKINLKKEEYEREKEALANVEEEIRNFEVSKSQSENELSGLNKVVNDLRREIEEHNADIIDILNESATAKAGRERHEQMLEQARLRKAEQSARLIQIQGAASDEGSLVDSFKQEEAIVLADLERSERELENCQENAKKISDDLLQARNDLGIKERLYHEESSRYNTLKNITERYDGYGVSIRKVMEQKQNNKGIIGVVADIIHVNKSYEIAIETALGGSISNIVTDNENTAKQMISFLKNNRFGRATFLPLTSIKGRTADQSEKVCKEKGVVGLASDLVQTESRFKELTINLLGRVFVVDNIDNALAIAKKYHYSLRIVTLEGESLNPGGSLSGGAYKNSSNLLSRRREMEDLKEKVEQIRAQGLKIKNLIDDLQDKKNSNKDQIEKLTREVQELKLRKNTIGVRMKAVLDSHNEHNETIKNIKEEIARLLINQSDIIEMIEKDEENINDLNEKQSAAETAIETLSRHLEKMTKEEAEMADRNSDIRVQYTALAQKKQFAGDTLKRLESELDTLSNDIERIKEQLGFTQDEEEQLSLQKDAYRNDILENNASLLKLQDELLSAQNTRNEYADRNRLFFTRRQEVSDQMNALDKELFRLNNQKEKLDEKRVSQSNYMWEEYNMTYNSSKEFADQELLNESTATIRKLIADVKNKIKVLGNINVNAIEEYKEVSERYELLKTQHDDLVAAEENLTGIIESLDESMKKQFRDNFGLIQKEFNRVFKLLFGGGQGTLSLSDPDNILETGIIITAQPPGKKLQNMMQLSGGEKALSAIALLFAIQSLKPSPFCLLDEIEAALDDANVKRFAEYLHKLTNDTQFIVITHRRGTMNAADVLYGITMQEKGVSTLVSVNLIENELTK